MLSLRPRSIFAVLVALTAGRVSAQSFTTDAAATGSAFSPGVRGLAIPAVTIDRGDFQVGMPKTLEVSNGSSLRGVAGGLEADLFDWKTRNNSPREGTLNYLRYARDRSASLYITANIRGLVEPDPNNPGSQRFYDTSIPTLASLAGDWVRYTNRIAQIYRQGDTITDPRDQSILNSLVWSSSFPGDNFDKLLAPGEAAVPTVKYWEIGNEPRVGLSNSYKVTNSYTFTTGTPDATHKNDYAQRYAALTTAMRAEDPAIKVGPALQYLSATSEQALLDSILVRQTDGSLLPVDFLGYHPYQKLNEQTTSDGIEAGLRNIYADHLGKITFIKSRIAAAGRDPNSIALVASEHNASNWSSNDTTFEATMAHGLANTETVFSFARLGVQDAHYWVWPAHRWDGTQYPNFHALQKLRDFMGDKLLSASADVADNLHLYTTRDSKTKQIALWALNFDNDTAIARATAINNVGGRGKITLYTLGSLVGPTNLMSSNLASDMAGGPTHTVDWTTSDLTGTRLDTLNLTFPAATISLVVIDPWRQLALPGDANLDGIVNSLDSVTLNSNLNQNERNWQQADFTGDGIVNQSDVDIFNANNGQSVGTKWIATGSSGSASWTTRGNWQTNIVPNGNGASADLTGTSTAQRNVTIGSAITVGSIQFDHASSFTLSGSGSINLRQVTTATPSRIYVIQGNHTIAVPLSIVSNPILNVARDCTLTLTAPLTVPTGKTLTQSGPGSVVYASGFTLPSGSAAIISAGRRDVYFGTLSMSVTAKLDLADNTLIVGSGSFQTIKDLRNQGRAPGATTGILSSGAGATQILALFDNALAGLASWHSKPLSATSIVGQFTYFGDMNLDGAVSGDDYTVIDSNLNTQPPAGIAWLRGDANLDGFVTGDDYTTVDSNLASGSAASLAPSRVATPTPEPTLSLVVLSLLLVNRRYSRR